MGSLCRLCNTRLRVPVIPRFVPNEPSCHTRHGASHIAVQPSLQAIVYLKYWVRSGQNWLHQLSLHLIFLYLSLFLPSSISVVRCCYESSFTNITRDVCFLGKGVYKYENTNFPVWQSRGSRASSITGIQLGIDRRMLYSDAKMSLYMFLTLK